MNGTVDTDLTETSDDGGLDPQAAAALLKQTGERARRGLDTNPPSMSLLGAAMFLIIYGGIYMAARNQHPYVGPKGPWLIVWPVGVIGALALNTNRYDHMKRNLTGATLRRVRGSIGAVAAGLVGIYTMDGALLHEGASKAIVYGIFDAGGPLIVMGSIGAAISAWREDWPTLGVSVAIIAVATGAAFAGPDGCWGVIAIGGCLACLAHAALKLRLRPR
jgi:hypothetical protein